MYCWTASNRNLFSSSVMLVSLSNKMLFNFVRSSKFMPCRAPISPTSLIISSRMSVYNYTSKAIYFLDRAAIYTIGVSCNRTSCYLAIFNLYRVWTRPVVGAICVWSINTGPWWGRYAYQVWTWVLSETISVIRTHTHTDMNTNSVFVLGVRVVQGDIPMYLSCIWVPVLWLYTTFPSQHKVSLSSVALCPSIPILNETKCTIPYAS